VVEKDENLYWSKISTITVYIFKISIKSVIIIIVMTILLLYFMLCIIYVIYCYLRGRTRETISAINVTLPVKTGLMDIL
jgi:hypothetical protein